MHNIGSYFPVFRLVNPHVLEGGEGTQYGASHPYQILLLRVVADVKFSVSSQFLIQLILESFAKAPKHKISSSKHYIL